MASSTSLFTGLSGLTASARNLEVIGNNIANVNTPAFKSSRLNFADAFYRTVSSGSAPGNSVGGTDPYQIGQGVMVAGTQRDFRQGTISATGNPRDLAIDGEGFFVVADAERTLYTRAGGFSLDADQNLVTPEGLRLQGYLADDGFNIGTGALGDVRIPIGGLTITEATENTTFQGNLNAGGALPTRGSLIRLLGSEDAGFGLIAGATVPPANGNALEAASLLTEIETPDDPGSGAPLFAAGQIIELRGATRGNATVPTAEFAILPASTVQDLMDFLAAALGIQTTGGPNPDGGVPGVSLDPVAGVLSITGNPGTIHDLDLNNALNLRASDGEFLGRPFVTDKAGTADGESVRTTFIAYDSLGTPLEINLGLVLESKGEAGTTWRYFADSADDTDDDRALANGSISFDTDGRLQSPAPVVVSIDRAGTGAASPQSINLRFADDNASVTAVVDDESNLVAAFGDGSPIGTLQSFGIQRDGTIVGSFSNSLVRPLARIALATFTNAPGLVDLGSNLFRPAPNSGDAMITPPGVQSAGQVVGGSLELSNVDLGEEFTKMILTSTGYSASSRVIRTADELLQQLLVLGR